ARRSQEARRILLPPGLARRAGRQYRPLRTAAAARGGLARVLGTASTGDATDVTNPAFLQRRPMILVRPDGQRKRVFIVTYGRPMTVYDSARMADVLRPLGYDLASDAANADLVVLNTCHIREKASEKVYSELGRLRDLKAERRQAGRDLTIAVA